MESRFNRNFLKPEVRKTSDLSYHTDDAPGVRRVFVEDRLLPEADCYVMLRTAHDVQPDQPKYVDAHAHNVSSIYLFFGNTPDLGGLTAEVILDGEKHVVHAPASVFIPKGVVHSYRLTGGSGYFLHTVMKGDYEASLDRSFENATAVSPL
jgi:2-isopropylmalate synthase